MLEIGVQNGGSLDVYCSYFTNAQIIVGTDINPACARLEYHDPRINVVVGNCLDDATRRKIKDIAGKFDVIVDDASHHSLDTINAFLHYFPMLDDRGVYVIEDLCCSYWSTYGGGLFHDHSSLSFFKLLVDVLNFEHWGIRNNACDLIQNRFPMIDKLDTGIFEGIESIQFHNSICIIRKNVDQKSIGLGTRAVSGSQALVAPAPVNGSDPIRSDESGNVFSFSNKAIVPDIGAKNASAFDLSKHQICFRYPSHLSGVSAWIEHIPFGFAMVSMLQPRSIVELGTHYGDSYFAFCEAVQLLDLDTRCYAIDTWLGDEHSGRYGPEVLETIGQYNVANFHNFSTLIQSTFDDSVSRFSDREIDLLHIDGLHTYEAAKHDLDTWLPKLSERGIILFHDTQVRERYFGVWRLWQEVSNQYPSHEFHHCHGLGVLAVGDKIPAEIMRFLSADTETKSALSQIFAEIGGALSEKFTHVNRLSQLEEQLKSAEQTMGDLQHALEQTKFGYEQSNSWKITAPLRLGAKWALKNR